MERDVLYKLKKIGGGGSAIAPIAFYAYIEALGSSNIEDLSAFFNVSRATVGRVMRQLENAGFINRVKGVSRRRECDKFFKS